MKSSAKLIGKKYPYSIYMVGDKFFTTLQLISGGVEESEKVTSIYSLGFEPQTIENFIEWEEGFSLCEIQ